MPFNLLLLPLLGGYWFVTHYRRTKFVALRSSGYHLLFKSALVGFVLLLSSYLLTRLLIFLIPEFAQCWRLLFPFRYSGTSVLALLLGLTVWKPLNWLWEEGKEIVRAIEEKGDPLELILQNALALNKLVLVTIQSGKVYIGWLTLSRNPAYGIRSISLLPAHSGYRKEGTLEVEFTTDYLRVYRRFSALRDKRREGGELTDEEEQELALLDDLGDFIIGIPIEEIVSVSQFNPAVYNRYFHPKPGESEQAS